jgi:hypothetical protein
LQKGLVEWTQGEGPEFKPQYHQKKRKEKESIWVRKRAVPDNFIA